MPCSRAASRILIVPSTFTSQSWSGRSTETRTSTCAARWRHASGRRSAKSARSASPSRTSPTTSSAPSFTFSRRPEERSSSTVTSSRLATSASTTCEPMKPAPPVTMARTADYPTAAPMFVTFEGVDGSGKTTQARLLAEQLRSEGREVVLTRKPGGTALGERLREIVLWSRDAIAPWAETALFAAARAQLVDEVIRPALARGADVVCDRYLDSSLAYQGLARGLGVERVLELNLLATSGLLPDRTFLILLPLDEAAARAGGDPDRIEREGRPFLEEVDKAYRELARVFAQRITVVDGTTNPEDIARHVR